MLFYGNSATGCSLFFVAVATEWFNFLFLSAFFFYTEKKE